MRAPDTYKDPLLTNISVKFEGGNFIGDEIFPTVEVDKETGFYFKYSKDHLRIEDARRDQFSQSNRVEDEVTTESYGPLEERSLHELIPWRVLKNFDNPYDPKRDATLSVTHRLELLRENALATTLGDTAVVTQNTTLSGTAQLNDYTNSDPFGVIQAGVSSIRTNSGREVTLAVMGRQVFDQLIHHTKILDRLKYTAGGVLNADLLAAALGVNRIVIGDAVKNTAKQGQADSTSYVWGKNILLAHVEPRPTLMTNTAGYRLRLRGARMTTDRWIEDIKCQKIEVTDFYEDKLVSVEALYLVKNAVA